MDTHTQGEAWLLPWCETHKAKGRTYHDGPWQQARIKPGAPAPKTTRVTPPYATRVPGHETALSPGTRGHF